MAEYITSTSSSSLHLSPNRKRTRESHPTRSSNGSSPCKTTANVSSNIEVTESPEITNPTLPSITQPRSSIHSVQNGLSSVKFNMPDDTAVSASNDQNPIIVSILFILMV